MNFDKYKTMTPNDIATDILKRCKKAEKINDAVDYVLANLAPETAQKTIDALEALTLKELCAMTDDWCSYEPGAIEYSYNARPSFLLKVENRRPSQQELAQQLEKAQSLAQASLRILQYKGDAATPLTKGIVNNVGQLSDEEYNGTWLGGCGYDILNAVNKATLVFGSYLNKNNVVHSGTSKVQSDKSKKAKSINKANPLRPKW